MTALRVVFANKDPLLAYHKLKTEIPYSTFLEFLEMLDVYEAIQEQQEKEVREKAEKASPKKK